ncbi:sulfite exporter TauE/SafE family protein [Roseobacter sinensis]|uniref:Probable membrane transporter protein n=1 Tax=Roseobacter sinensis TaxID=2931391 RepID=A0ABT3BEQ0_9RHOB|nr:sulfite exporter TauE/SafE family protein [Roseobacter sp. WL0113]MCV3272047.1 sulfite exporter TauE/SafE family protein [Roseobacter sp. WL0113]
MTTGEMHIAGLDLPVALTLLGLSFLSSLITAAFGIGGGTMMLAVMATLLPASALIPVHGLVQLGSNAGRACVFRHQINRAHLLPFTVGAVLGVAIGSSVVVQLDAGALQMIVGLFVLWTLYLPIPRLMKRSAGLTGALSSGLTMFVGGTGPFIAAFVKTLGFDRTTHVATHAAMMTVQHLLKTVAFGLLGFAFSQWIGFVVLLILFGFLGTLAGRSVLVRLNEALFQRVLTAFLTLLALRLVYAGGAELLWPPG